MDSSNNKQSEFERRSSQRQSSRFSIASSSNPSVPQHRDSSLALAENAVFDALTSDGPSRPMATRQSLSISHLSLSASNSAPMPPGPSAMPMPSSASANANASSSSSSSSATGSSQPPVRSSIAKPPSQPYPQPQQQKSDYLGPAPSSSSQMPMPMSANMFALASESTSAPPSGPSHPYAMYQQGISDTMPAMPTMMSAAVQPQMSQGPSHPYGMFPQSIDAVGPVMPQQTMMPTSVPVAGFPGAGGYQRRIGPDGEESGLVGPLGHTEELPPYTRYPEEGHSAKSPVSDVSLGPAAVGAAAAGVAVSADAVTGAVAASSPHETMVHATSSANVAIAQSQPQQTAGVSIMPQQASQLEQQSSFALSPISGAGGIGLATRDPEFASTNDLDSPRVPTSRPSFASDHSNHEINTAARDISEKGSAGKKPWQIAAQRKIGGVVPVWALMMLGAILLIMGIVLGAVIGTLVSKQKKHPPPLQGSLSNVPSRAQLIPLTSIPSNLASLTTGMYNIPPLMASAAPTACINDTTYSQAWSCSMPVMYNINIEQARSVNHVEYSLTFSTGNYTNGSPFIWGNQPINLPNSTSLTLVNDTSEISWGPAWWFNMTYDKVVIISEDRFPAYTSSSKLIKRGGFELGETVNILPLPSTRAATVAATAISTATAKTTSTAASTAEETVVTTKDVVTLTTTVVASATATHKSKSSSKSGASDFSRKGVPSLKEGDMAWICTWHNTRLDFLVYPDQNNSLTSGTSSNGIWPSYSMSLPSPTGDVSSTSTTSGTVPSSTGSSGPPTHGNLYPKVVRISEQRVRKAGDSVICRKVQIVNGGQEAISILDDNGDPVEVQLVEKMTSTDAGVVQRRDYDYPSTLFSRDSDSDSECACAWSLS